MKFTHYIYIATTLATITACKDYTGDALYSVGEEDNAIVLSAGISEGGSAVLTRAAGGYDDIDATNHTKHLAFATGTQATLRIDGTWLGHDPVAVSLSTTATIGAETTNGSKHNSVTLSPIIYWDDFGTADPANMPSVADNGRAKGLTIYGAAVNGETSAPTIDGTTGKKWTEREWSVGSPTGDPATIDQTNGWNSHDLLTTNNVRTGGPDDTYKFDEKADGKLLEFTHAMTKITVNLTAGAGFADGKFVSQPSVTLLDFNYTGSVNIEAKTSTPTASTTTNILTHFAKYKETSTATEWTASTSTWTKSNQTQFDALVFPGNQFADATDIIKIEADGNTYYVNATKINEANTATGDVFEQAKNYVFDITVSKTGIDVSATIKDWKNVEAANETPIIGFSSCYGQEGDNFAKSFTFYRSTAVDGSFLSGITEGNKASVSYDATNGYAMSPQLYWPNHSTHYFFRGIWPVESTETSLNEAYVPSTSITHTAAKTQIAVQNVAYKQATFPSDLMIGMPRKADGTSDEACKAGHKQADGITPTPGICATDAVSGSAHDNEGLIHMNFQYAMSQVYVELSTSEGGDKVTFDEHTKVEIVDGYTEGAILLGNQASDFTGKTVGNYIMNRSEAGTHTKFHDAIIPQLLSNGTGEDIKDLKFRITIGSEGNHDVYETVLGIKNIKVTEGGTEKSITSWEPGKKYTYKLYITKTNINVVATLTDWITVTADQPIWF